MMTFYCNNCGYYRPTTGLCQITGNTIDPNHAICDNFLCGEYYTCKACHTPIFHKQMIIDDQGNTYCDKCWAKLNTCANCEQNVNCAFDASPDTPKMIQSEKSLEICKPSRMSVIPTLSKRFAKVNVLVSLRKMVV